MSSYYEKILATGEVKCIDEEIPFEVPESWSWARLTHITYLIEDCPHSTAKDEGKGFPLVRTPNIGFGQLILNGVHRVSEKVYNQRNVRAVPQRNDLIFAREAPAGNIAVIYDEKVCLGQRTVLVRPITHCILSQYLAYYILSPSSQQNLVDKSSGTTVAHVNLSDFRPYLVAVPPIKEQHRIVNKIVELIPLIEKYGYFYERIQTLNKGLTGLLKKAILQDAIQGKLVPQIAGEGTAKELLEQIKAEKQRLVKEGMLKKKDVVDSIIYKGDDNKYYENIGNNLVDITDDIPFEIPNNWVWTRIGYLFAHNNGKQLNKGNTAGTLMEYITTSNLYWDGFRLDHLKMMPFEESEIERCQAIKGDLLVCEGGDIGRSCIWDYDFPIMLQNHIHKLRPYIDVCTKFFFYIFYLYNVTGVIGGKGIGIQGFSAKALHNTLVPLPPLQEQQRIVAQIEKLFEQLK